MLAPVLGATLIVLLVVALVASSRRSRALVLATHEIRESHARRLLQERLVQEKARLDHERSAFLADVSKVVADSLDAPVAVATVARLAVPFLADACVMDLADDEGDLTRVAAVHQDPAVPAALQQRYQAARPIHPLLAQVLRDGRSRLISHGHEADLVAAGEDGWRPVAALLVPLLARGRTLGVVSLFSFESGRRFGPDDRALAEDLARRIALGVDNTRLYHAAVDSHRRFHDLVEGLGAIVWEADAVRRHYTFVSGRAVALVGYALARWHDEADFWLTIQHPDDRADSAAESRAARAEGRDHDLEYRVVTADGRILWMLDLVRVVRHPDGGVRHLRGVMVDITQGKRAELAQREGEEARRHAAALASVAALANAAAHEINNPLAVIMGNLELVSRRADTPSVIAVRTDAMLAAGRRIAGIVGSMRRITRLENVPSAAELPAMLDLKRSSTADDP
jgi:PAS domain S-box-containing protein